MTTWLPSAWPSSSTHGIELRMTLRRLRWRGRRPWTRLPARRGNGARQWWADRSRREAAGDDAAPGSAVRLQLRIPFRGGLPGRTEAPGRGRARHQTARTDVRVALRPKGGSHPTPHSAGPARAPGAAAVNRAGVMFGSEAFIVRVTEDAMAPSSRVRVGPRELIAVLGKLLMRPISGR